MAIYNGDGTVFDANIGTDASYTATECVTAFVAAMNAKAAEIGMTGSTFVRPAGDTSSNQVTCEDMALLTLIASSYKNLAEIWSKDSYTCTPRNEGASAVTVTTTVSNATLEAAYPILGGKTGHWEPDYALACLCDVNGKQVIGYIHGTTENGTTDRFGAMKELMDIAATIINGGTNTATVIKADEAIAVLVPTYYTANYEKQSMDVLYSQSADDTVVPASTTKILTAITTLDWIDDITDTFELVSSDMIGGSGSVFSAGDIISYKDALYALMLPSSNQCAQALARMVGKKILTKT